MRMEALIALTLAASACLAGNDRELWSAANGPKEVCLRPRETGPATNIVIKRGWRVLELSCEAKCDDLKVGQRFYDNGRIFQQFSDDRGKKVGKWPDTLSMEGTQGWRLFRKHYEIPAGAKSYELKFRNAGVSGMFSFRNVRLRVALCDDDLKPHDEPLPAEYTDGDPWDLKDAWRETNAARLRICLNGIWRCRIACSNEPPTTVPRDGDFWGWAKVPGMWMPNKREYRSNGVRLPMGSFISRKDAIPEVRWFRRKIAIPAEAKGRRVILTLTGLHSKAEIIVDGKSAATVLFPEGEADLTAFLTAGREHELAMRVSAWPCDWEKGTFDGPATPALMAKTDHAIKKSVERGGLTGDVYLDIVPKDERITGACVRTDVAKREITFIAEAENLTDKNYRLVAEVTAPSGATRTFDGEATRQADGSLAMVASWTDAQLWSPDTPSALYRAKVALADMNGKALDIAPQFRFGFRDVKTAGRHLLVNGHAVHLRGLFNASWTRGAEQCSKPAAEELCRRLKDDGVSFIIAGNYAVQPGQFTYLDALLDACDESGILYAVTLPHAREFGWFREAAQMERFEALTAKVIRHVRNHPSVFAYAMTHNRVGYAGDIDPERIRGDFEFPTNSACKGMRQRREQARLAEGVAHRLDPSRPVYHHEGGSIGDMQCCNCYLNWSPVQERSEWIRDWAEHGVKPLMFIEWGMPHIASWSSYRGPLFIWTRPAYQSVWGAEFAAAFRGDAAFDASPAAMKCLDREEGFWRSGEQFRYGNLNPPLREWRDNYQALQAQCISRNLRDFRAWGLTGFLPWDQGNFYERDTTSNKWAHVADMRKSPRENPDAWRNLKRPGIVSDDFPQSTDYWTDLGDRSDFVRTEVGEAWRNANRPQLGFIGGGDVFTDQRHDYAPGETIAKRLVLVNDESAATEVAWECSLADGKGRVLAKKNGTTRIESGETRFVPIEFAAPSNDCAKIAATMTFAGGEVRRDEFRVDIIKAGPSKFPKVRLFDPVGKTTGELTRLGVQFERIGAHDGGKTTIGAEYAYESGAASEEVAVKTDRPLVIGRGAMTRRVFEELVLPQVRACGRVLVFEQDRIALESLGFRVQEYGLRNAFPRYREKTLGGVLAAERLHDWAGEATLIPSHLKGLDEAELGFPRQMCNGFYNTRVWRCGNRGNVASVLIEKPTVGNWRAFVDGAFDLQYTPLVEWTVGGGAITFCQMDVTSRTVREPAADELVKALVSRLAMPVSRGSEVKALGMDAELALRDAEANVNLDVMRPGNRVFVVSSGARKPADWEMTIRKGATALCLGLTAEEVRAWSPEKVEVSEVKGAHYQRIAELPPELNGLSNADWAWHGTMDFAAFQGEDRQGNAAFRIIRHGKGNVIFWQVPPWKIDDRAKPYLRLSRRRAEGMLSRLLGNLGLASQCSGIRYADSPIPEDDPYRYIRW